MPRLCSYTTLKIARVATSRGTRLPYFGYHSSRKYQRSLSGMDFGSRLSPWFFGTQTRPPSPRADAAANAVRVEHGRKKLPVLVLLYLAFGFVTADLLVERVEKLLARSCSSERGAIVERAAEAAEIEQTFGRAIERNAHPVEQIDNAGRGVAHCFYRWLVGEEVASVDGVVEMLPGGIAFAFQVLGGVDASLRANRVRTLYGDDGKQINLAAHLGDLDNGGEACQTTAHYDDFRSYCHAAMSPICRARTPGSPRTISLYVLSLAIASRCFPKAQSDQNARAASSGIRTRSLRQLKPGRAPARGTHNQSGAAPFRRS